MRRSKFKFSVAAITLCVLLALSAIPAMAANGMTAADNADIKTETGIVDTETGGWGEVTTPDTDGVVDKEEEDKEYESNDYESNEIVIRSNDMLIDDNDPNTEHRLAIYSEGAGASSFFMRLEMPYFVEVSRVEFTPALENAESAVSEISIDGNYVNIAYSSAENFYEGPMFYVSFYLRENVRAEWDRIWAYGMQFVNADCQELYVYDSFGYVEVRVSTEGILMGDANQDGEVTLEDVMYILRAKVAEEEWYGDSFTAADVDRNGYVDMLDCQYIQNYLVGKIESLDDLFGDEGDEDDEKENCSHNNNTYVMSRIDATCVKSGIVRYYCMDCESEYTQELEPTGKHSYVDGACENCGTPEDKEFENPDVTVPEDGNDAPSDGNRLVAYEFKDESSNYFFYDDYTYDGTEYEKTASGENIRIDVEGMWDQNGMIIIAHDNRGIMLKFSIVTAEGDLEKI